MKRKPKPPPVVTPPPTPTPNAIALGAYLPNAPGTPSVIDDFTTLVGTPPDIVMWYQQWAGPYTAFSAAGANAVRARGAMPLISWEPWAGNKIDPVWSCQAMVDGNHDAYIKSWAGTVAAWGFPIYVRLMYEMNGDWTAWSPTINGNTPALQIAAWRHVVNLARAQGAVNIRWVWSPNITDGNAKLTPYPDIYPGDGWVDWLGLDGYNWGSLPSGNGWQTFTQVFETLGGSYSKITALSQRPLMIAEVASAERNTGDKGNWITSMFGSELAAMPRIKAVTWFNANKETDWRVNSSASSLAAYKTAAAACQGTLP